MKFLIVKKVIFFIVLVFFVSNCKKEATIPGNNQIIDSLDSEEESFTENIVKISVDSSILIPVGQLIHKGNSVDITINGKLLNYDLMDDGLGGYWAIIPNDELFEESILSIKITRRLDKFEPTSLRNDSTLAYLKNSKLINWNFYELKRRAKIITDTAINVRAKALAIQKFVMDHVDFDKNFSSSPADYSAFQTFSNKKGVCINFARLFIAMCRAVGIKARSVSGGVLTSGINGYFHHHEWAEFLDEDNLWHPIDLTFTDQLDFNDIRYIDFTYCAEETECFADYYMEFMRDLGRPFRTKNECVIIYCYLPIYSGAKFGFELIHDAQPDSLVFEKSVTVKKINNTVSLSGLL